MKVVYEKPKMKVVDLRSAKDMAVAGVCFPQGLDGQTLYYDMVVENPGYISFVLTGTCGTGNNNRANVTSIIHAN